MNFLKKFCNICFSFLLSFEKEREREQDLGICLLIRSQANAFKGQETIAPQILESLTLLWPALS